MVYSIDGHYEIAPPPGLKRTVMTEKKKGPVAVVLAPVQWEYTRRVLEVHMATDDFEEVMAEMSLDGWELVGLSNYTGLISKRILDAGSKVGGRATNTGVTGLLSAVGNDAIAGMHNHESEANPGTLETVGVFKRPLTKEREQELKQIKAEAAVKNARAIEEAKEAQEAQDSTPIRRFFGSQGWFPPPIKDTKEAEAGATEKVKTCPACSQSVPADLKNCPLCLARFH